MPRRYRRERINVHNLHYHFIWCPKYRKKVLNEEGSSQTIEVQTGQ